MEQEQEQKQEQEQEQEQKQELELEPEQEQAETPRPWKRILSGIIVLSIVIIGAVLGPVLQTNESDPKSTFLSRCKKFNQ